jgi:hypothetical protein
VSKFIPAPEFAILQEQRIKELEQYASRVYNTLKFIGQSTTEPAIRERAYATLETEPVNKRCTRSHPHELMDDHCNTMTWIERASAAMRSEANP